MCYGRRMIASDVDLYRAGFRRRPNARPTVIYWLFDTRTNTPFYCGKTVIPPAHRLAQHKRDAVKGRTKIHAAVRDCGDSIVIHPMEIVLPGDDWGAREKRWIQILRHTNPNLCNTADGGAGTPGRIVSAETRAKIVEGNLGRKHSAETRAKLSAIGKGKKRSVESVEKGRAKMIGRKLSAEHIAKVVAANKGKKRKPHSAETRAKISAGNKGKVLSAETRQRMRAAQNSGRFKPGQNRQ